MNTGNFNTRDSELQSARSEQMRLSDKKKADREQRRLEREERNQALRNMQNASFNPKVR